MKKRFQILAAVIFALLIVLPVLSRLLVDWLWFDTLGFQDVFATIWWTSLAVFAIAAALTTAILLLNGFIAAGTDVRPARSFKIIGRNAQGLPETIELSLGHFPWRLILIAVALAIGGLVGFAQAGHWEIFLKWLYAAPFDKTDPVLHRDLGFYVFTLPVYKTIRDWALLLIFLCAAMAGLIYTLRGDLEFRQGRPPALSARAWSHFSVLLALFFFIKTWDYGLQRYDLLTGNQGLIFGADYTDVHLRMPLLWMMAGISFVGALLCLVNLRRRGMGLPAVAAVAVFAASFATTIIPSVFQNYWVKPDELRLETPYIAHHIALTRYGFGLDHIGRAPFPIKGKLTSEVIDANAATIQNIRWWDPRPLLDTYRQLQEIRLYYDFQDIDVDRYVVDGDYRQVMLSARELNQSKLPPDAQTWINQRFKFTHGYGLAMNPVNQFDEEGLPVFWLKDIPPTALKELRVERPQIYFGEKTTNYVVVGGDTKEFDYAKGEENVYNVYQGRDGVPLNNIGRRALLAWYFGDLKLLISDNVTASSKILFRRLVQERIHQIAPFLLLDHDPYLVVSEGRLVWLQDAYTVSNSLAYSRPAPNSTVNYIRNSVKIAMDAYDGNPVFYVAEPKDPILLTYRRIFPSLFQPMESMPAPLRQHVRYPEDLFTVQASVYATYHMTDPEVFYNKEDLWTFPRENYGGQQITMQPYYTIMRLPGESREEFILMLPMVPRNRDNMIAWLAARCDGQNYGKLIEYAFSKEKLIYGPAQIEARIDQDTTISQQLSLWNQTGSRVIRGNLLVIPIDDTLLYVEPLYLSAESRQLPELKRFIATAGDRVVMSTDVPSLLDALTGRTSASATVPATSSTASSMAGAAQALPAAANAEARDHYQRALDALRKGDWRNFGVEMEAMEKALQGTPPKPSP